MKKIFLLLSIFVLLSSVSNAQTATQPELESGTIENQFDYIITKSSSFRDFQLIRKVSILKVKKNTLDSLKSIQSEFATTKASIAPLQATIKQLEADIVALKLELEATTQEKDSIAIFGEQINKSVYNTLVWSLVVVLLGALLFFVFQFKNSHSVTKKAKLEVEMIENQLEDFKKKAMKKEQELMRKLQDELNKNS